MAGPVKIAILANGSQVKREVLSVNRSLGGLGKGLKGGLAVAGITSLTAGVVGFGISAIKTEKQFSTSMRLIQASTGATAGQMKQLNDLAIRLGADTAFSANDAADAMLELSKAGLNTKTIMGGGVAGTLTLAAAGGTDLATAATIASNALNTFNLSGKDTEAVAAALAGGANASTASVESLGQALQQVGPGATNAGLSLQETVAALAAFDSAGIKGSDAGTSLKTMLTRLVPSTNKAAKAMDQLGLDFTKADGSFLSLDQIAQQLQDRLSGLTQEQRTQALATVFGSDATRAATVLMNEGAAGIRKYIKATNDQSAAQKMASARMSGTEGALERLSGSIETAKLRLGQELAPIVTKAADGLSDKLVPAMEAGIDAVKLIGSSLQPVVPLLKTFGEVVVDIAQFIDGLPAPLKEMGVQAGIAALVMPRLAAGVTTVTTTLATNIARLQQWRAEMTYSATRAQALSAATSRLGGAARSAAGIGGMLLLSQATKQTDDGMKLLTGVAGGLATGFAIGGPWGAAIGGAAGLLGTLTGAFGESEDAAAELRIEQAKAREIQEHKQHIDNLRASLDELTGAYTRATREAALNRLEEEGLLDLGLQLGLSNRNLVDAALGHAGGIRQVTRAIEGATTPTKVWDEELQSFLFVYPKLAGEASKLERGLAGVTGEVGEATRAQRNHADAVASLRERLGATRKEIQRIPRAVRIQIQDDVPDSVREIKNLQRETGKLDRRTIRLLLDALPVKRGKEDVESLINQIARIKPAKVDVNDETWRRFYSAFPGQVATITRQTGRPAIDPNLNPLYAGISTANQALDRIPDEYVNIIPRYTGGRGGGKDGDPSTPALAAGQDYTTALADAIAAGGDKVKGALARMLRRALRGLTNGSSGISAALDRITDLIRKQIDLKDDKKERQREREILRNLRDQYGALQENGKAQDRLNKRLEEARNKLREIKGWVNQVKQSFIDTGNITTLGIIEGGNGTEVSGDLLIDQLKDQVADAERFAALIKRLRKEGLNKTTLEQLLAAGPEAGLAAAEALDHMTEAELKQINDLTSQLAGAGQQLGESMSSSFFAGGLGGAEQTLKNLLGDQKDLEKQAERLGRRLARAIRRALRGKDQGEGTAVLAPLLGGTVDTHASNAARRLGRSMREGFDEGSARSAWMTEGHQPQTQEITVRVSPDEWDRARRGKDIRLDLEASDAIGVRVKAVRLVSKR